MNKLSSFFKNPTHILILTTVVAFLFYSWGILSWKFSYVGDEWASYAFAKNIVLNHFSINPFSMNGVYGENPVLGSVFQSFFMWILGVSNFSWRISNTILVIPLSIFFYKWLKLLINKEIAFLGTILLQFSFYLANFFKIGYINPQALLLFVLCCYLATLYSKTNKYLHALLYGLTLGISFYIYIGPLFPLLTWSFLLPLYSVKHPFVSKVKTLSASVVIYILLILPGVSQLTFESAITNKTILHKEFIGSVQIAINIFHNLLLFFRNYDYFYNHFVTGPYIDVTSRFFLLIGIIVILKDFFNNKAFQSLILSYLSVVIIMGLTSPYIYTPTTRGIIFLPYAFIFIAIGLYTTYKIITNKAIIGIFLAIIIFTNIYLSQWGVFSQIGHPTTALIIKELQQQQGNYIVVVPQQIHYELSDFRTIQEAYKFYNSTLTITNINSFACPNQKSIVLTYMQDKLSRSVIKNSNCKTILLNSTISPTNTY